MLCLCLNGPTDLILVRKIERKAFTYFHFLLWIYFALPMLLKATGHIYITGTFIFIYLYGSPFNFSQLHISLYMNKKLLSTRNFLCLLAGFANTRLIHRLPLK